MVDSSETWVADTGIAVPERVGDGGALVDGDSDALGSIVEGAVRAEATTVGLIDLSSCTLNAVGSVPEGVGRAGALSVDWVPGHAVVAGLDWAADSVVEVGSVGAVVVDGRALVVDPG